MDLSDANSAHNWVRVRLENYKRYGENLIGARKDADHNNDDSKAGMTFMAYSEYEKRTSKCNRCNVYDCEGGEKCKVFNAAYTSSNANEMRAVESARKKVESNKDKDDFDLKVATRRSESDWNARG